MDETTLVELIEAYEAAVREWVSHSKDAHLMPKESIQAFGAVRDGVNALHGMLIQERSCAASWRGTVYRANGDGSLEIIRGVRSAEEIDGEGR